MRGVLLQLLGYCSTRIQEAAQLAGSRMDAEDRRERQAARALTLREPCDAARRHMEEIKRRFAARVGEVVEVDPVRMVTVSLHLGWLGGCRFGFKGVRGQVRTKALVELPRVPQEVVEEGSIRIPQF